MNHSINWPLDWVRQLRNGTLPQELDPQEILQKLADDLDIDESCEIFANVDVPEIDDLIDSKQI